MLSEKSISQHPAIIPIGLADKLKGIGIQPIEQFTGFLG